VTWSVPSGGTAHTSVSVPPSTSSLQGDDAVPPGRPQQDVRDEDIADPERVGPRLWMAGFSARPSDRLREI